jgi:hypothetical protein
MDENEQSPTILTPKDIPTHTLAISPQALALAGYVPGDAFDSLVVADAISTDVIKQYTDGKELAGSDLRAKVATAIQEQLAAADAQITRSFDTVKGEMITILAKTEKVPHLFESSFEAAGNKAAKSFLEHLVITLDRNMKSSVNKIKSERKDFLTLLETQFSDFTVIFSEENYPGELAMVNEGQPNVLEEMNTRKKLWSEIKLVGPFKKLSAEFLQDLTNLIGRLQGNPCNKEDVPSAAYQNEAKILREVLDKYLKNLQEASLNFPTNENVQAFLQRMEQKLNLLSENTRIYALENRPREQMANALTDSLAAFIDGETFRNIFRDSLKPIKDQSHFFSESADYRSILGDDFKKLNSIDGAFAGKYSTLISKAFEPKLESWAATLRREVSKDFIGIFTAMLPAKMSTSNIELSNQENLLVDSKNGDTKEAKNKNSQMSALKLKEGTEENDPGLKQTASTNSKKESPEEAEMKLYLDKFLQTIKRLLEKLGQLEVEGKGLRVTEPMNSSDTPIIDQSLNQLWKTLGLQFAAYSEQAKKLAWESLKQVFILLESKGPPFEKSKLNKKLDNHLLNQSAATFLGVFLEEKDKNTYAHFIQRGDSVGMVFRSRKSSGQKNVIGPIYKSQEQRIDDLPYYFKQKDLCLPASLTDEWFQVYHGDLVVVGTNSFFSKIPTSVLSVWMHLTIHIMGEKGTYLDVEKYFDVLTTIAGLDSEGVNIGIDEPRNALQLENDPSPSEIEKKGKIALPDTPTKSIGGTIESPSMPLSRRVRTGRLLSVAKIDQGLDRRSETGSDQKRPGARRTSIGINHNLLNPSEKKVFEVIEDEDPEGPNQPNPLKIVNKDLVDQLLKIKKNCQDSAINWKTGYTAGLLSDSCLKELADVFPIDTKKYQVVMDKIKPIDLSKSLREFGLLIAKPGSGPSSENKLPGQSEEQDSSTYPVWVDVLVPSNNGLGGEKASARKRLELRKDLINKQLGGFARSFLVGYITPSIADG